MGIKRRTVYVDKDADGNLRFWDYATVTTTVGSMVEPFLPGLRHATGTKYAELAVDEINRIDQIQVRSIDEQQLVLGGGFHTQGGTLNPRTGR